ncbi:MAG: Gfo/Idh/MocA family oxidoreductase [Candidatus Sumerlaeota bacterium]|nr:Gfo/Idh/MocA family oxidoreductase [Candidatus Sumerlaeota bacterium]
MLPEETRRQFFKRAARGAGALALFTIVPRHVLGGSGQTPPSEQLTKAIIGVGGMGTGHIKLGDERLLAVCEVDELRLQNALKNAEKNGFKDVKGYKDFREVLERPDIDIAHIPTPPHWHALISIAAAKAGKDIWCEKPMSRTIYEGQKVVEAVQQYGRIFRLNTWFRFQSGFYGFGTEVFPIKKLVNSGMLGWPLKATVSGATGFAWKFGWRGNVNAKPEPVPPELDYDFWLGPAPYKPYHKHRVHGTFRGYWDYDGGGLGDMGQHYLDPVQYLLDKDNTSPVEVEVDAPQQDWDACGTWRRIRMKYADGCEIILEGEGFEKDAPFLEGPNGKLFKGFKSDIPNIKEKLAQFPDPEPQLTDFSKAVRTRQKFALNESNGFRSCTLVNMAKTAVQLGQNLKFDPVKCRFIDNEAANRLVEQPMRAPWHV